MRKALALVWLLLPCMAFGQAFTTVTATNVLVDNGSGTAVHPPAGSSLCFLGVNNAGAAITYTPSGGSPTSGTVCQTLTSGGALTGTLQVANPATASPNGLLYTITVINGGTTYLTIPTVSLSGFFFNFDAFALPGTGLAVGIGKAHLTCANGAQWTSTTLPAGQNNQRCNSSGLWDAYPPANYCPAGMAYLIPQQGGPAMCQAPTFEGSGAPTGSCTDKATYLDVVGSGFYVCKNSAWMLVTGGSGTGITQLTGDVLAGPGSGSQAATLPTVNSNVGTCGDSTHVGKVTLNAKGLTTACTPVAITGGGSFQYTPLPLPPSLASFTWVNQGTSTTSNNGGMIVANIAANASNNWRLLEKPTAFTTPWSVAACWKSAQIYQNSFLSGLYLYDGTKLLGIEWATQVPGLTFFIERIPSVTSTATVMFTDNQNVSGGGLIINPPTGGSITCQRWRDDGTSLFADWSLDGSNWNNFYSEPVGNFITPTAYGFGGVGANGAVVFVQFDLVGWLETNSAAL